jgi:hypothetical protein
MIWRALTFLLATNSFAATLSVALPPYLANCTGFATAQLSWSGATGPVQIRIGSATGVVMTGPLPAAGSIPTGNWVTDGLTFFLVDASGNVQASAAANFNCGGTPRTIDVGFAGGSYFPLAVGNTWVYKENSRFTTANYLIWSITGTQVVNGQTYYVLSQISPSAQAPTPSPIALLRSDANGVLYQSTPNGETVYLDPGASGTIHTSYSGPLGVFNNVIQAVPPPNSNFSTTLYARGLGMVNYQLNIYGGSDGGFGESLDLVDVRVDGVHLSIPAPKIALAIEQTDLDLTNHLAPNCTVPCYYPACGIGGGPADPPGFYRPCAQIRIDTDAVPSGYTVLAQLLDSSGTPVFKSNPTAGLAYLQVPLYSTPSLISSSLTMLPAGNYTLTGTIMNGATAVATSSIAVQIH